MAVELGKSGEMLRSALERAGDSHEITVLILEAARIGDRLEQLNRILTGDAEFWTRIDRGRDGVHEIRVDSALQEARQQAGTLRQLIMAIRALRGAVEAPEDDGLADL